MIYFIIFSIIPFREKPAFSHHLDVKKNIQITHYVKGPLLGDTTVIGTTTYDRFAPLTKKIVIINGEPWTIWGNSNEPSPFTDLTLYLWTPTGVGPVFPSLRTSGGCIDGINDKIIISSYYDDGSGYKFCLWYTDTTIQLGQYSYGRTAPDSAIIWPVCAIDGQDNIDVIGKTYQFGGYSRIFSTKTTWGYWDTTDWSSWQLVDTVGDGYQNLSASKLSSKFAAAYEFTALSGEVDSFLLARNGHLYVKVSTDGGENWNTTIDMNQFLSSNDSLNRLVSPSPFFDDIDSLHLVFLGVYGGGLTGGYWYPGSAVNLWHWSKKTGLTKVAEYGWTPYNVIGNDFDKIENTYYLDVPSIGEDTTDGNLYIVYHSFPWNEEDLVDSAQTGDIYIVRSRDNGATWGEPVDLTNSPNHSEVFPSVAPYFFGDTVHLVYLNDVYGGSYALGTGYDTVPAENPVVYMRVPIPSDGDVGVASIISPQCSITPLVDTIIPEAVVENLSSINVPAQVKCLVYVKEPQGLGYDEVYTDLIYDTLPPFSQDTITFQKWVPDTFYGIDSTWYVRVSVAYLGDINTENDTLTTHILGIKKYSIKNKIKNYHLNLYPNPTYQSVNMNINVPENEKITLNVYDIAGRNIKTLINNQRINQGGINIQWRGIGRKGNKVKSGIYFIILNAKDYRMSKKVIFLRKNL